MATPNDLVIQTQGLSKSFRGVNALRSLNLQVHRNSIFGFLGPNGAGKTTTIKLLLELARPTGGSAALFGYDVVHDSVEIRKRVGYLAQDPRFYEYMTARETLRYTARFFFRGPKEAIESRVNETLELVGLADKADRPLKGFSGGHRHLPLVPSVCWCGAVALHSGGILEDGLAMKSPIKISHGAARAMIMALAP